MSVTAQQVKSFTASKIERLCTMTGDGPMKAAFANLRRGVGRTPGDMPELWGMIFCDMPEAMMSTGSKASNAEWAVYTALTLFALHQQGRDPHSERMSQNGESLGKAVRRLAPPGDEDAVERVLRRFNAAATSDDMEELSHHLRGIVQLLRSAGIAVDYPALSAELYLYQFPEQASLVRLRWGQDFYRIYEETKQDTERKEEKNDQEG